MRTVNILSIPTLSCLVLAKLHPGTLPKSFVESPINPPPWQIHSYNDKTYILRQSGFTDYEKPFLYLMFGEHNAFLLDTGSINGHPLPAIEKIIEENICGGTNFLGGFPHQYPWQRLAPYSDHCLSELIVGHSHSHDDHIAGDSELKSFTSPYVKQTVIIPPHNITALKSAYSIHSWPDSQGQLDLGNRVLDIIPIPGHQTESIAVYDRQTGLLFTGDSVYPGRLYIPKGDLEVFKASHDRLEKFAESREVSWVLGCHIEQKKTPFEEYPTGTIWQPDEHVLQFEVCALRDVGLALEFIDEQTQGQTMFQEFSLVIN